MDGLRPVVPEETFSEKDAIQRFSKFKKKNNSRYFVTKWDIPDIRYIIPEIGEFSNGQLMFAILEKLKKWLDNHQQLFNTSRNIQQYSRLAPAYFALTYFVKDAFQKDERVSLNTVFSRITFGGKICIFQNYNFIIVFEIWAKKTRTFGKKFR